MRYLPVLGALALLSAPGCTGSGQNAREIRTHLPSEPVTLDPALAEDDYAVKVLCNTMDGLYGYDGAGELHPKLAEKTEVSADGKRYTFTIRANAQWSDGKPVTAADFVTGLRRSLDPKTSSKLANMFYSIRGARAYSQGKARLEALGVREEGGKLVIELAHATSYFPHVLTLAQAAPERADVLEANGGHWPELAPATGPYRIVKFSHDQEIRLEPNPHYWNPRKDLLPVVFRIILDESQAVSLFETGKLDVVGRVPPLDLKRLRATGNVKEFYQVATFFLAFNTRKPPFNDRDFRRAVAGTVDREGILSLLGTASKPARSWIPPHLEGYLPYQDYSSVYADSVARVKAKLAKGQAVKVTAALTTGANNSLLMEKLQQDLLSKLGFRIELQSMEFKAYVNLLKNDTPQLYRFQRGAPFMDPIWHLISFTGDDVNNYTGWKNAEYDRLVDEIAATRSGPEREKKVLRAEQILVDEEAIAVPVFHAWQTHLVSPRIKGYLANPINEVHYDEVSLAQP